MAKKKLVVIGGGAAGFFCAVNAARLYPDLHVVLLEKSGKLLSKVRISGGGRCNVTHACWDITEMSRQYPRGALFVKKSFHRFFTRDTVEWFESRGVKLKTEKDGRMFPLSDSSQSIIDCLLNEAEKYNVDVKMNHSVEKLSPRTHGFELTLASGQVIDADFVCVACGGFPKAPMFDWLQGAGHTIESPVPSLFTFNLPGHSITKLMGVSVPEVRLRVAGIKYDQAGALLITHWGLSGPVVLRASAWAARELALMNWNFDIRINWIPNLNEQQVAKELGMLRIGNASQKTGSHSPFRLPQRLWEYILTQCNIGITKRWADLTAREQNMLARELTGMEFGVRGKTTFKEEFVTAGGIRLSEVNPNTMMSKKHSGLFFAGEILDVDGITGGYNFQHAWTSGFIAAHLDSLL